MGDYRAYFKGKKITLMGLGLLGRGVGDAAFLAECGAELIVTDKKSEGELAASVEKLKQYKNITFHLGKSGPEDFMEADMIIKAAGVPLDSSEIAAARAAGVPVYMSTALFAKYAAEAGAIIVGVTGTRGKSTVAHMIFHALQKSGRRVHLGGNVRGISTLALLRDVEKWDAVVLELDSWQLQGFGDLQISPHIAVFTNLMPDHQNYYKDMEEYFVDKANIFRYQKRGDILIVGASIVDRIRHAKPPVTPLVPERALGLLNLRVLGQHNIENASFAAAALIPFGLNDDAIRDSIESFEPVEGRLQFVREINGIKIYNDNNATTPEATIAGVRALGSDITLIIGGSEKGLALEELVSEIKKNVSYVILLTHPNYKGSARLADALQKANVAYVEANDLPQAVGIAIEKTTTGIILFSPAFASFGMFKNEYDRDDQFVRLIKEL